ncbi:hypothetical protein BaRGS_00036005 [Batillaria attramentaria]|uniref:Uncharacterized protein n=1 Tax=Batillaria attramentaria TaxID=370345 RepID=A0ABD0JCQ9_9CAEN
MHTNKEVQCTAHSAIIYALQPPHPFPKLIPPPPSPEPRPEREKTPTTELPFCLNTLDLSTQQEHMTGTGKKSRPHGLLLAFTGTGLIPKNQNHYNVPPMCLA